MAGTGSTASSPASHRTALDTLLTPLRARVLLDLDAEKTMTAIATTHYLSPSAATYQVGALLAAGLVYRRKQGTAVRVGRSRRGNALIRLYLGPGVAAAHDAP